MYMSAQALWHSVGFGTAGIYVAAGHCSDGALQTQVRTEARSISERLRGLEPWFLEVTKPESPLKGQKEVSALLSEAQRLQSETEQLQRETERMKRETRHLGAETQKNRRTPSGRGWPSA
jgi:predicted RNase H-like nuclease (RuvC/YqgF family)